MPLLIEIKTGDKLIINGAVIENAGANCKILLHNEATVLRGKEVLSSDEAQTPASRAYYALQCAYIFPEAKDEHLAQFRAFLADYLKACPSAQDIGDRIYKALEKEKYYNALKHAQKLIRHENDLITTMLEQTKEADLEGTSGDAPPAVEPPSKE